MNDREQLLQWQIQGGAGGQGPPLFLNHTEALTAEKKIWGGTAPPLCKGWMTAHPPLLISRSGSSTVLVSTLGRRLSDKDVHKEGKHQSLMTAFLAGAKREGEREENTTGKWESLQKRTKTEFL